MLGVGDTKKVFANREAQTQLKEGERGERAFALARTLILYDSVKQSESASSARAHTAHPPPYLTRRRRAVPSLCACVHLSSLVLRGVRSREEGAGALRS